MHRITIRLASPRLVQVRGVDKMSSLRCKPSSAAAKHQQECSSQVMRHQGSSRSYRNAGVSQRQKNGPDQDQAEAKVVLSPWG